VSGETDPSVLPSFRTLYETEREQAQARIKVEATYEAWSPNSGALSTTKEKMALAILIQHGFMSETMETGSLEDFKQLVEDFIASASRWTKTAEAFMGFSIMEVSAR
jgi:hypothetical protein